MKRRHLRCFESEAEIGFYHRSGIAASSCLSGQTTIGSGEIGVNAPRSQAIA